MNLRLRPQAQVIDKGIPTVGLLAQVMIANYADHLPLYRQEIIFGRAGLAIPRSTLAQWVATCGVQLQPLVDALREVVLKHDVLRVYETLVQILAPGSKKTHRAYVWAYVWAYATTRLPILRQWFMTSTLVVRASMPATFWDTGKAS
ncbi:MULTISPECIES: IS66 family transposase [Pseudomonas]|uniref:IS66 family transposase n=1 Tax=Pseudomonas TaxID=286 RepID=UPI00268FA107|nr:transposase [Pseudomonas bubulae]